MTAAIAGISALGLLSGCGMETRQQAAAIVNDEVIPQDAVQSAAEQLAPAGLDQDNAVVFLIAAPLVKEVSDTSGRWQPNPSYAALLAGIPDASQATKDTVQTAALMTSDTMTPADVQAYRKALDTAQISLNPKYGEIKKTNDGPLYFTLGAAQPDWLAPAK
ncbi:MAG: hypothetical protein L0H25_10615 [Micrococcales bacterium]|nr:hypothetical protein [Micrococcales bacterium]